MILKKMHVLLRRFLQLETANQPEKTQLSPTQGLTGSCGRYLSPPMLLSNTSLKHPINRVRQVLLQHRTPFCDGVAASPRSFCDYHCMETQPSRQPKKIFKHLKVFRVKKWISPRL
jgi:hypothetical protein